MLNAVAGVIAGTGGVSLLYVSWSGRLRGTSGMLMSAWSLVALSFWFWTRASGVEFGPVIAAIQLSLVAWIFILANPHVRRSGGRRQPPAAMNLPRVKAIAWHTGRFCIVGPLAAVASTTMVLAAITLLPWADVNRLAFAVLAMPLVWGGLAYWTLLDSSLLRPAVGLVAGLLLGATVLSL